MIGNNNGLLKQVSNHQKTVTSVSISNERLISASLDHQLKVYDLNQYSVLHTISFSGPILCFGISPSESMLAVGMADNNICIRRARRNIMHAVQEKKKERMFPGTHKYLMRGKNSQPDPSDFVISSQLKPKLQVYETFLKKFEYGNALQSALATGNAAVVVAVLSELVRRDGLAVALNDRDPLLLFEFLRKNISDPAYSSVLIDITNFAIDTFMPQIGRNAELDSVLLKLSAKLQKEVAMQQSMYRLMGTLEALLNR